MKRVTVTPLIGFLACAATAWEFPPVIVGPELQREGQQRTSMLGDDDVDIVTGSRFHGLKTFANLPYVFCFSEKQDPAKYDIAILGAPFDTSVTARPGARYGPQGIRVGSQRVFAAMGWDAYSGPSSKLIHFELALTARWLGENALQSWATIVDCGDAPLTWLDNTVAFKQLDKAHQVVSGRSASNISYSKTPRILTLGGDHATTLSALRSVHERWGPVSVIHFDSHIGRILALSQACVAHLTIALI
jgi:agmatinase